MSGILSYGLIFEENLWVLAEENPARPTNNTLQILVKKYDTSKFGVTCSRTMSDLWLIIVGVITLVLTIVSLSVKLAA